MQQEAGRRLTDTDVSIDAGITGRSRQVLILAVRDVQLGSRIAIPFGETKVNYVHQISPLSQTHQEVVRFDVPVDEVARVDEFDPTDLLLQ